MACNKQSSPTNYAPTALGDPRIRGRALRREPLTDENSLGQIRRVIHTKKATEKHPPPPSPPVAQPRDRHNEPVGQAVAFSARIRMNRPTTTPLRLVPSSLSHPPPPRLIAVPCAIFLSHPSVYIPVLGGGWVI